MILQKFDVLTSLVCIQMRAKRDVSKRGHYGIIAKKLNLYAAKKTKKIKAN